ncbi:MAG: transposase [Candidatus Dormibacteraceae bacterium]
MGLTRGSKRPSQQQFGRLGKRREFCDELKQRIVMETSRPGASASEIARRYGLDLRLLRR